jgi:DNA-binding response OmpR family regulator
VLSQVCATGTRVARQISTMTPPIRIVDALERSVAGSLPVVFVVDDDVATLELLSEVAREVGWRPRGFRRLGELREAIERHPPDLLILDDDLPDGLGGDLARELRHHPRLAGVPLLVCTAAHPMRRAEIGAWAPVVAKPFDLVEIERFLDAARAAAPGTDDFGIRAG